MGADDVGDDAPALQVVVLGSGGGPQESNTSAFLVRSIASGWRKGSIVAVDAGVHLSAITRILEETQPAGLGKTDALPLPHVLQSGPFRGYEVPYASAAANAALIQRTLVDTYLITHPHLDHIAGFVINTAGTPGSRPKRLAGLPGTISAFKTHIFNNVIWPNLSDENNGAGLVTYMRLVEGGSPALGDGEGKGYLELTDGLAVKTWGVSHGHCIERHSHRGSTSSQGNPAAAHRYGSVDAVMGSMAFHQGILSPRSIAQHNVASPALSAYMSQREMASRAAAAAVAVDGILAQPQPFSLNGQGFPLSSASQPVSNHMPSQATPAPTPGPASVVGGSGSNGPGSGRTASIASTGIVSPGESVCVYDSCAYFMRDVGSGREVLIFGDVEPDSISLSPRNAHIWAEAAPKIAAGKLRAIFIECSYDDSQSVDRLYGHLTPRFLIEEMSTLAVEVEAARARLALSGGLEREREREGKKKRKRAEGAGSIDGAYGDFDGVGAGSGVGFSVRRRLTPGPTSGTSSALGSAPTSRKASVSAAVPAADEHPVSPKTVMTKTRMRASNGSGVSDDASYLDSPHLATPTAELSLKDVDMVSPLTELTASPNLAANAPPLRGLKVVIIHMKDKLNDGPSIGEVVLSELLEHEKEAGLGCEFVISGVGQEFYL